MLMLVEQLDELVRAAKDAWFQHKVLEAERGRNGGKLVWRCIRDIQWGRRGLVPVKTVVVKDDGWQYLHHSKGPARKMEEALYKDPQHSKLC